MKLKRQVILFSVTVMIALLIQAASGLVTLRTASDDDNKARVIQLFKSSYNTIVNLEKLVTSGQMEEQQAKSIAIGLLRGNIYKSNEYVFVANEDMDFLAAPLDPQLHGTSFHDFKDAGGQSVGQILIDATRKSPSEMAMYEWEQKQEDGSIEKKLSIAQETPLWGWYVGTGIGSKEVNARFVESAQSKIALSILIIALIFALLQAASKSLFNTIGGEPKDVLKAVKDASEGKVYKSFDVQAPSDSIYEAVQRMSSNLAELAENLESSTHSLNSEVCGVESRSAQLKKLSESQQQSTEMIAAAVTEMSASADITSGSASNVASDADLADEKSKSSAQLIRTTVDEITALSIELEGASKAVKNLDTNVNSIVTVLDVIRDIAEQTNLLALNAAIEAARAGEQGRGFAVVADEVRNLASRTQDSTKEIQSMINDLQDGSANALRTMSQCAEASRKTVENSEGAEMAISEIVSSLRSISNKTQEIATAAAEQTGASSDISQRINSIETGSSDITDVVVENHEAAKVLGNLSEDLGRWVKQFDVR